MMLLDQTELTLLALTGSARFMLLVRDVGKTGYVLQLESDLM